MSTTTLENPVMVNPAFRNLIPPLTREERAGLEASILAHGCQCPLVTWRGVLLDGHNRYDICRRHDIDFETTEIELTDEAAARAETRWFRKLAEIASHLCFPSGRVKFWRPHDPGKSAPLQGQVIAYKGANGRRFADEFLRFGAVLTHAEGRERTAEATAEVAA